MFNTKSLFLSAALLLLASHAAHAWWLFSGPTDAPKQPAIAQQQQQQQQQQVTAPLKAMAHFDMDDVRGLIQFSQVKAGEPTRVEYDLSGLKGNNKLYHVHVRPVPPFDRDQVRANSSALAKLCGDPSTGGHLNPHHITQKLPPKSAPLDKYETGDLSGKHGPLKVSGDPKADRYMGSYLDDKLPMTGPNSIVGRSIVIHKNDGARWVCATIEPQSV